jgi:class 3 adenylate cyclase
MALGLPSDEIALQSILGDTSRGAREWAEIIRSYLDDGQCFAAQDLSARAVEAHTQDIELRLLHTLSMIRSGALDEARAHLDDLYREITPDVRQLTRIHDSLKRLSTAFRSRRKVPVEDNLEEIAALAEAMRALVGGGGTRGAADPEKLTLLGELFKESWRRTGEPEDLSRGRNLFLEAHQAQRDYRSGIGAALMSGVMGESEAATALAGEVLERCRETAADAAETTFDLHAAAGHAYLLLGDENAATSAYRQAVDVAGRNYSAVVGTLQELELYQRHGLAVPAGVQAVLQPPAVVVFAGTPLDFPGATEVCFPPAAEAPVRARIAERLDELEARIGYSSAACGADLLFIELMLERDAEINIVLPFHRQDFERTRVRYAGAQWERRFRNALRLANSVSYATEERYLGHDVLFRYCNQILMGEAQMRAEFLSTAPYLIAVWDFMLIGGPGTAADFIDHWPDITRFRIVDLGEACPETAVNVTNGATDSVPPTTREDEHSPLPRVVKAMLFADVVGYSKLAEEHLPGFRDFLSRVVELLGDTHTTPDKLETWGDAIFAVLPNATSMAEYALALQRVTDTLEHGELGLPVKLRFRVGLHAGPVFEADDPLTGRPNVYGNHVNRAARIEPVATPGEVYASKQFIALLQAEQSAARHEAESCGQSHQSPYAFEYLGILPLAKKYGQQPVYQLKYRCAIKGNGNLTQ